MINDDIFPIISAPALAQAVLIRGKKGTDAKNTCFSYPPNFTTEKRFIGISDMRIHFQPRQVGVHLKKNPPRICFPFPFLTNKNF